MSYSYFLHPLAVEDYLEAYAWYEERQQGLGERFLRAVRRKIEEIGLQPKVYGSKGRKGFREAKVEFFPYIIVYKVKERSNQIYITAVHHVKKKPGKKYRK